MDFPGDDLDEGSPVLFTWEKRTRRYVDEFTFACRHEVDHVPRIEDIFHERAVDTFSFQQPRYNQRRSKKNSERPTETLHANGKNGQLRNSATLNGPKIAASPIKIKRKNSRKMLQQGSTGGKEEDPTTPRPPIDSKIRLPTRKSLSLPPPSSSSSGVPSLFASPVSSKPSATPEVRTPRAANVNLKSRKTIATPRDTNVNVASTKTIANRTTTPTKLTQETSRNSNKSSNELGAFLHRNAVEQISEKLHAAVVGKVEGKDNGNDDLHSVGSRSISSKSIAELSHAERSKAEDKLPKRPKRRRYYRPTVKKTKDGDGVRELFSPTWPDGGDMTNNVSASSGRSNSKSSSSCRTRDFDDMRSIDELSTADFSESSSPIRSPRKSPQGGGFGDNGGILGSFLRQMAIDEEDAPMEGGQGGAAEDVRSVVSASTIGSKSISALSKAEQSGLEKKLRSRAKHYQEKAPIVEAVVDSSSQQPAETERPSVSPSLQPPAPPPIESPPSFAPNRRDDDSDNQSIHLDDVAPPIGTKQLRFKDGHSEREIPELTDSLYDELFYTSEELGDFRYEAFLEECGLDVDEFK